MDNKSSGKIYNDVSEKLTASVVRIERMIQESNKKKKKTFTLMMDAVSTSETADCTTALHCRHCFKVLAVCVDCSCVDYSSQGAVERRGP
jgi:hypothetical protein